GVKRTVKKIFNSAGLEVTRRTPAPVAETPQFFNYDFETDETFKSIFREGVVRSGSTHDPNVVHQRLYNTVQFLKHTIDLEGDVAECGAFRGLSSFLFCNYIRLFAPDFDGRGYHIFDSFEGLSEPREEDAIARDEYGEVGAHCQPRGAFLGTLEVVKATLSDYPAIEYHRGWIPESLSGIEERQYKFVHLDLDLYEPIKGALHYFYPRMVRAGVIVVDEYAIPRWPGAKRAVDEYCSEHDLAPAVSLTTGNGVLIKK
ncbi:MAG TPA: TylF/MycF/NovP-related O-methyltransferase, partial [Pyrinomonadaceae bacterium]